MIDDLLKKFCEAFPERDAPYSVKPLRQALIEARKKGADPDAIISGTEAYAATMRETDKAGTRFVQAPLNWIRDEGWTAHRSRKKKPEPIVGFRPEDFVLLNSDLWNAIERYRRSRGQGMRSSRGCEHGNGTYFHPDERAAALAFAEAEQMAA